MSYATIENIIKPAIRDALQIFDTDAITPEMIQMGVDFYNTSEPIVWRAFPWQTKKYEAEASPDSDGVITLDSDTDIVRAVRAMNTDDTTGVLIWHEDEIRSAMNGGEEISSDKFDFMADTAAGVRRIRVNPDDGVSTYKILAFRRFPEAEVSGSYNASSPGDTPNDYRVLTWKIDQAKSTLISYITDRLRGWNGAEENGKWQKSLNGVKKDLKEQQANEQLITPATGAFGEAGNWE